MVEHLSLEYSGSILSDLAKKAKVPVCAHLDHCSDFSVMCRAIKSGFSSIIYDGSKLPLAENIKNTALMSELAHACGVSIEGEVGIVGYTDMPDTITAYSNPDEVERFVRETTVDAVAVSVGTLHRMTTQGVTI